ncbi:capsular polysaccharide biosynthesis protein [Phaeovulum vinaykumarii]|uniref:Capsular polysaccharide export protein n=1 Tax=Phaeovulum vinaykumarii TaxID=407234 RepID=A0A1N7LVR1_9RHOB|nr:capsular polysaccharide export protein [Phaeovulum vinaykumarii]SOC07243.1 capsular polysaccharide biosynthesis protein [Phaeovulum vinaykumarii]
MPRRNRRLTRAQLFAASHILAPIWWDPCRGRLCRFEEAVDQLEAEVRAFRQDRHGHVATGMRAWKRAAIARHFGRHGPLRFIEPPAAAAETAARTGRPLLGWASRMPAGFSGLRVEDGFLRSRGLGADLVAPLSLVCDARGIYYDPTRPSDLEALIAAPLPAGGARRAEDLIARITDGGLTKYNLGGACPALPPGHRILVPGQVEDDASIRLGAPGWTNRALLERVRAENPDAVIVWKPHPDVVAGLRPGALDPGVADALADVSAPEADPAALIAACDEVWTLTSGLGFEALLRGRPVTCLGTPFYAGWGLTRDLGPQPARRRLTLDRRPDLARLVHAALIAYPRYIDPVSGRPCPPEVVIERLARGQVPPPGPANRALARLQGLLAPWAHLWRRSAPKV